MSHILLNTIISFFTKEEVESLRDIDLKEIKYTFSDAFIADAKSMKLIELNGLRAVVVMTEKNRQQFCILPE